MKTNYQGIILLTVVIFITIGLLYRTSKMDKDIEKSIKETYVFKTYLKDDSIKAKSKNGGVTLSGTVNQQSDKGLAQETVENLPGVKNIDNRLELKAEYPPDKSNEWLAMNIKSALLFYQSVSGTNTKVYVEEGIVTLRGEANSQAQKELTGEYAEVAGVREVRNEMTVAKGRKTAEQKKQEKIDDASITAQVKTALSNHRSTSTLKTSVKTKEGIVTLEGKVQNLAEKNQVTKLASDILGVKSTVNNMSIVQTN